jgi:hypothetical protein
MDRHKSVIAAAKACVCEIGDSSHLADRKEVQDLKALINHAADDKARLKVQTLRNDRFFRWLTVAVCRGISRVALYCKMYKFAQ